MAEGNIVSTQSLQEGLFIANVLRLTTVSSKYLYYRIEYTDEILLGTGV